MPFIRLSSMEFTHDQDTPHNQRFIKDVLKNYDDKLDAKWNGKEKCWWILRQKRDGKWIGIMKAKILDNRILDALYEGDLWKHGTRNFEAMIDQHNHRLDDDKKRYEHELALETAERAWVNKIREHKDLHYMRGSP